MTYNLKFDEKAITYLEKLPKNISHRIFKKLEESKENPHHYFDKLKDRKEYKLRVGDYRIIADIIKNDLIIFVVYINHRSRVYKN